MDIRDELDTTGAIAATTEPRQTASGRSIEDSRELDAIEDDEVRQILKIPPRRKLVKSD
jgi:hypothetical protein